MKRIEYEVFLCLLKRYDYEGAIHVAKNSQHVYKKMIHILYSCKHATNFDFQSAYEEIEWIENDKKVDELKENLKALIEGKALAIFSELVENTKIQLFNGRYIDFLSRVYRLKEAILKYIFAKNYSDEEIFSFRTELVSKRMILKILKKKYKIYNPNLSFAITSYIQKYLSKDWRYKDALEILNSSKMNELIELRHGCIVGHGFLGINHHDLEKIYGEPYEIIEDFCEVLRNIGIHLRHHKYHRLNKYLVHLYVHEK